MELFRLLRFLGENKPHQRAVFGFDAFIDQISRRVSGLGDGCMESITDFGQRLLRRDGKSGAVFLEEMEESIGGNAPNTALTLSALGGDVTCICALGYPRIKDTFLPMQSSCRLISYADPGTCLALELGQNKLFIGHNGEMNDISWEELSNRVGRERLLAEYRRADLIGLFNWGELTATQCIWEGLLQDVFPHLSGTERKLFFDFSDISARKSGEIALLKDTLRRFRAYGRVYVSVNQLEEQLLQAGDWVEKAIADVVIIHGKQCSRMIADGAEHTLPTRYQVSPKRVTGGGDCFNAGFCFGLLCGLPAENCLMIGNAAANCLIRTGKAPDKTELCLELERSCPLWECEGNA